LIAWFLKFGREQTFSKPQAIMLWSDGFGTSATGSPVSLTR
jgi:hypothetical protein